MNLEARSLYWGGLKIREIAVRLGVSDGSVCCFLYRRRSVANRTIPRRTHLDHLLSEAPTSL